MKQQEAFDFDGFWLSGPWVKAGKKRAARHFKASVKTREDFNRIQGARDKYAAYLAQNTWMTPQHGSTWFNNWEDWMPEEVPQAERQGFHWCEYCEPSHEWACADEDCHGTRNLACQTFLREFDRRQKEALKKRAAT